MTLTPTEVFLYGGALTALGWLLGHRLALRRDTISRQAVLDRERDLRKRQFHSFVVSWRCKLDRTDGNKDELVWACYTDNVCAFKGHAAIASGDFEGADFASLVKTIGEWRPDDVRGPNQKMRNTMCSTLDKLDAHIQSTFI